MSNMNEKIPRKQAIRESSAIFQALFDDSADAYLILDDNIFVDCNQATVEMLRASNKEEVLSTHPSQLSPEFQPDGRPSGEKADEMIRIALEKGSNRFEWIHRRVDGEDFPVEVLLTPIPLAELLFPYQRGYRWVNPRPQNQAGQHHSEKLSVYRQQLF